MDAWERLYAPQILRTRTGKPKFPNRFSITRNYISHPYFRTTSRTSAEIYPLGMEKPAPKPREITDNTALTEAEVAMLEPVAVQLARAAMNDCTVSRAVNDRKRFLSVLRNFSYHGDYKVTDMLAAREDIISAMREHKLMYPGVAGAQFLFLIMRKATEAA